MIFGMARHATSHGEGVRSGLLGLVRASPGISKSELQRQAGIAWGTLGYHLAILRQRGLLQMVKGSHAMAIYPSDTRSEDFRWIQALRSPVAEELLACIRSNPGLGVKGLTDTMAGLSRKTVRRHLLNLEEAGAIWRTRDYHPQFHPSDGVVQLVGASARPKLDGDALVRGKDAVQLDVDQIQ